MALRDIWPNKGAAPNYDAYMEFSDTVEQAIDDNVVGGTIDEDGHLLLEQRDGSFTDAGPLPVGPEGPTGAPGGSDESFAEFVSDPGTLTAAAVSAKTVEGAANALVWKPTGSAASNRTSLQAAVDQAIAQSRALLLALTVPADIAGTVNVTGPVRIFGYDRRYSRLNQTTKPSEVFVVSSPDVTFEDLGWTGAGLDMTGHNIYAAQRYSGIRIEPGAHNFTARRLYFEGLFCGLLFSKLYETSSAPAYTDGVIVEDVEAKAVWAAFHGGPFRSPKIDGIRGTYIQATSSNTDVGAPPHLVYLVCRSWNGTIADTVGGSLTNVDAWDGPTAFTGAAVSLKNCVGLQYDQISARNCPGVLETDAIADCIGGTVTSVDDIYPATGSYSNRAAVAIFGSVRCTIDHVAVRFKNGDHGRAIFMESTATDCTINTVDVIDNSTVDRTSNTQNAESAIRLAGTRNVIRAARISNIGQPKWTAIHCTTTGSSGRVLTPRIGDGYQQKIRVGHNTAFIDYDPTDVQPARDISGSTAITVTATLPPTIRDRSVGQAVPRGYVDEFNRGVTVTGLATTDDGKLWRAAGSGGGINTTSSNWRVTNTTAKYIGAGAREAMVADGGAADGTVRTTIGVAPTGELAGLSGRVTDWNNYIAVGFNHGVGDGKLNLYKRVGSTRSDVAQSATGLAIAGAVIELVLSGTSVSVKVNGVQVIAPQTISDVPSSTFHGLLASSTETALTYDRVEFVAA